MDKAAVAREMGMREAEIVDVRDVLGVTYVQTHDGIWSSRTVGEDGAVAWEYKVDAPPVVVTVVESDVPAAKKR